MLGLTSILDDEDRLFKLVWERLGAAARLASGTEVHKLEIVREITTCLVKP